jgi:hypothetical protein
MVTTVVTGSSSADPVPRTFVVNVAVPIAPAVTLTGAAAVSDNIGEMGRTVETLTPLISWISFEPPVLADQPNFTVGVVARMGGSASVKTGVVDPSTYTRIWGLAPFGQGLVEDVAQPGGSIWISIR